MKQLHEYNLDIQFPAYIESEILFNRDEYANLLIRKGYAKDPNAPNPIITEKTVTEESITELFDALEAKVKADFAPVRRRGPNKPKQGQVSDEPKTGEA